MNYFFSFVRTSAGAFLFALVLFPVSASLAADCNLNGQDDSLEADIDVDGVIDACDNCLLISNPDQYDSNGDGYGNICDADIDNNGVVNFLDLAIWRDEFLGSAPDADFNGDGAINFIDLGILAESFFTPPGPGLPEANQTPVADAGDDVQVFMNNPVNLDGTNSSDGNNDLLSYQWAIVRKPAGANALLIQPGIATPVLVPDSVGTWEVQLVVNDGMTDSLVDTVEIEVLFPGNLPSEATWMADLGPVIANKKLKQTIIPGTHDSGLYDASLFTGVAIDCQILNGSYEDVICEFANEFNASAQAQSQSIYGQLLGGIRYFDMRLCEDESGPIIELCHTLKGDLLSEVLNQIDLFLSQTEREIIIIDYRFLYGFDDVDHETVFALMRQRFGDAMVSESDLLELPWLGDPAANTAIQRMKNLYFDWLWNNNKRVIVGYGSEKIDTDCSNDDIQSLRLEHVKAGVELTLYDASDQSASDDSVYIRVKQDILYETIDTLEASYENEFVEVIYTEVNGLNGKVSSAVWDMNGMTQSNNLVKLYDGIGAQDSDLECHLKIGPKPIDGSQTVVVDFTGDQSDSTSRDPYPLSLPQNDDIWRGSSFIDANSSFDDNCSDPTGSPSSSGTSNVGCLTRRLNADLPLSPNRDRWHILQAQLTPQTSDFPFGTTSLETLAGRSNPDMVQNLQDFWRDQNLNIIFIDFYENSDLVQTAIDLNSVGEIPPGEAGYQLFEEHDNGDGVETMKGASVCRGSFEPPIDTGTLTFTQSDACDNDSADSGIFYNLKPGFVVRIFDDSAGSGGANGISQDDWIEMEVLQEFERIVFDTFEDVDKLNQFNSSDDNNETGIYDNGEIRVVRHGVGNINDRVSRMEWGYNLTGPTIDFMENIGATGDLLCSVPATPGLSVDFTQDPMCNNDEASALVLHDVPAGTFIRVYDSSTAALDDDWAQIWVKQDVEKYTINILDADIDDSFIEVIVLRDNGLSGKVSRVEIDTVDVLANTPPSIEMFYENDGFGEVKCTITSTTLDIVAAVPLEAFYTPASFGCSNDSIRSMVFRNAPAGLIVKMCDDSGCSPGDDISVTTLLQTSKYHRVGTFEETYNDTVVNQVYFEVNGLDGKISRLSLDDDSP